MLFVGLLDGEAQLAAQTLGHLLQFRPGPTAVPAAERTRQVLVVGPHDKPADAAFRTHELAPLLDRYGYAAILGLVLVESFGFPAPAQTLLIMAAAYAGQGRLDPVLVARYLDRRRIHRG